MPGRIGSAYLPARLKTRATTSPTSGPQTKSKSFRRNYEMTSVDKRIQRPSAACPPMTAQPKTKTRRPLRRWPPNNVSTRHGRLVERAMSETRISVLYCLPCVAKRMVKSASRPLNFLRTRCVSVWMNCAKANSRASLYRMHRSQTHLKMAATQHRTMPAKEHFSTLREVAALLRDLFGGVR
ncbi:hypothetical protein BKA67DRAFT_552148 [Truncatella angustata]|uniref:Uncharacterized protein n=1 Tax=Truncatella angustata TaxID=152316 RepID=A0A9P8UQZ2_9PEZI|nr:uncharacterized protein BKA67DRAFT_552148 [Truncatella angustata]KAH6656497.1 hypothetical protein BKA67DRAFT_552148 [Truncatella angustata]